MKINRQNKNGKEILITYGENNSININIFNNQILMAVAGVFDKNLKELEKLTGSKIYFRGNSIAIKGNKNANEKVKDAIEYLINRFRFDKRIDKNDVIASLNKHMIEDTKTQSMIQSLGEIIKTPKRSVIPRSKKQKEYVSVLKLIKNIIKLLKRGSKVLHQY